MSEAPRRSASTSSTLTSRTTGASSLMRESVERSISSLSSTTSTSSARSVIEVELSSETRSACVMPPLPLAVASCFKTDFVYDIEASSISREVP